MQTPTETSTPVSPIAPRRRRSTGNIVLPMDPKRLHRIGSSIERSRTGSPQSHHSSVRVRIACVDDTVYTNMLANMYRLLRVAQETEDGASPSTTSALLAKKALQYRKLLARAQAVDVNDPTFDVASFMGLHQARDPKRGISRKGGCDLCD